MAAEAYDKPNRRPLIIGVTAPLLVMSITFVGIRFYGKGVLRKIIRADDWIILAASIFSIAVSAMPLIALKYDLGFRLVDADPANLVHMSKIVYANDLLYPTAVGLTKVSICFSYLHLFPSHGNKIFCYTMTGFVTLYSVLCLLLSLLECQPLEAVWDHSIEGRCLNADVTVYVGASLNSAIDLVVYLWPVRPLWKLQLPSQQRFGLVALFSVGLVVCVVGILRIYYLSQLMASADFLWNGVPIWVCSTLEVNLGIICACLTGVKPVMAILFPSIFGSSQKSHGNSRSYTQYGQRTGRGTTNAESFAFEQLSSAQRDQYSKRSPGDDKSEEFEVIAGKHAEDQPKNGVWVSISNQKGPDHRVPANAIGVSSEVTVNNEAVDIAAPRTVTVKPSDAGSEEWIFNEEDDPKTTRNK
ncbi:uncharacterized protein B0I36DRAFT_250614 [Microdochium trichocladiopsis]|uniref:Rhodopsin domain-containing protein n=1 Tax=Microdochium trichocladiopsis TaxID=1682393 RepID=A0A9P9BLH8_9PEZI|nr:uncharacterized protein B0I36DRAFT_250614 [Microdochium trichocladiopsis]KAH7024927.1 hypothetical protein B0I36DRAFT_250614 [Microdochium trichocladiopsis]